MMKRSRLKDKNAPRRTFSYFKRCTLFMLAITFLNQLMTSSYFFPVDTRTASFEEQTIESMNADVQNDPLRKEEYRKHGYFLRNSVKFLENNEVQVG